MTATTKTDPNDSEVIKDLGHLSAAVAHHVINAFSAIVSNAEMIRSRSTAGDVLGTDLSVTAVSIVETALDASQVARRLIDWTRRLTAVETQKPGCEPPSVDVNQLIREFVECRKSRNELQVNWQLKLGPVPAIVGDAVQLTGMLDHLVNNAVQALPAGSGVVSIRTQLDPRRWLVIEIADTGTGMSPETLKRATEPFFSTKSGHEGIGLTVAQAIWRRHRGAVSIESTQGQGTTIRLAVGPLPSADSQDSTTPARSEPDVAGARTANVNG
jgi:signal transduction histidine kinase